MANPAIGVTATTNYTSSSPERLFNLGSYHTNKGNEYIFIYASAAITAYDAVGITSGGTGAKLTEALATAVPTTFARVGVAQHAFAAGDYGFVLCQGTGTLHAKATCNTTNTLYCSTTAGYLDDSGTTGIVGIQTTTSVGSGANGSCTIYITSRPYISTIL
jgi:hypothetical protein